MQELKRLIDNGRFYHRQGRLTEAAEIYRQVRRANPGYALAHHLLGLVAHQQGKNAEALESLAEAVRLMPDNAAFRVGLAEAHALAANFDAVREQLAAARGLEIQTAELLVRQAVLWGQAERPEEAVEAAERAVAAKPDLASAHQVLGMLLREQGKLAKAADHLGKARTATPPAQDPQTTYALTLFALARYDELAALPPPVDERNRYREAVLAAIAAWQKGDMDRIEAALAACDRIAQERGGRTEDVYAAYHSQIALLADARKREPQLYRGKAEREVAVIGDMQSLSAANLIVPLGGETVRLGAAFVPGCIAVNLFKPAANSCRAGFEAALDRQPEGATVIASVGDLDCRYTIGFMDYLRRHPEIDGRQFVGETVQRYVDWVVDAANRRGLGLVLQGPPACAAPLTLVQPAEARRFLELVEHFNAELRAAAGRAGLAYIDLYASTVGANRRGREECYVDTSHVHPSVVLAAIRAANF